MTTAAATASVDAFDPLVATETIAEAAWALKARHLRALDVGRIVSYADHIILCHGTSERHAQAIADAITREMRPTKYRPIGIEGHRGGDCVLIDFGDIVVHVFASVEARREFNLDSMYSDAPRIALDAPEDLEDEEAMRAPRRARSAAPSVDDIALFDDA